MNELIIVRAGDGTHQIYDLQGDGSYALADLWNEFGIRNDACSWDEACSRLSAVVDALCVGGIGELVDLEKLS